MRLRAALAVLPVVVLPLAASCAGRPSPTSAATPSAASARASVGAAAVNAKGPATYLAEPAEGALAARKARKAPSPQPARPAPPVVTTPMAGSPAATALAEARLEPTSCEKISGEESSRVIAEMRAALAESYREWHDEQPGCWEEMREEYRARKEAEAGGGLMLRGYGSGGGGMGAGIGLGSVGTVAHGAGGVAIRMGAAAVSKPKAARAASGTNNQVASVDEADIVKTDGTYVYFAANGALRIAEAMNPKIISVTPVVGTAREMFVEGDRAVVYASLGQNAPRCSYGYDCTFAGDGSRTKVTVFDIADRKKPRVVRELELSGSLMAARRIGNAIHTVVADGDSPTPGYERWPANFQMCGTPEAKIRAQFDKLRADNEAAIRARTSRYPTLRENGNETVMCRGLLRTPIHDGRTYTSVVSFDMTDDKTAPTTATMQSRPGAVFASATGLYVSVVHRHQPGNNRWYSFHPNANEVSEIHKFRIGESAKDTRYTGSGTVPGHVLNQFAMDEWYGYLRIATTKGKVPDPKTESLVSVLSESPNGNLVRVGAVEHIAPGEDIRAVRFDDDRGYVVTFKKTDPLFVMDLGTPTTPKILGELKIPGFSTYIHRIDPDHLMSIGFDANDHGDFAYFDGVILQLFDVKKPTDPKLIHKEKIGTRGSSSEAATNHLAFNYFASEGLLAVPMTICEGGGDGRNGDNLAFSGLLVYDVDVERGFTRLGGVDHGTKGANCGTWWSNANSAVKRSVFLDDLVYSIAGDRAIVQRMTAFGTDVADLSLQ